MIIRVGDKFVITTIFNDKEIILEPSFQWSRWLKDIRGSALNTLTVYAKALERFWIWSLHNAPNEDEHLALYFSSYVKKLQSGFTINETIFNQGETIEIQSYISKAMADITINKEIAAVESFLQYVNMEQVVF